MKYDTLTFDNSRKPLKYIYSPTIVPFVVGMLMVFGIFEINIFPQLPLSLLKLTFLFLVLADFYYKFSLYISNPKIALPIILLLPIGSSLFIFSFFYGISLSILFFLHCLIAFSYLYFSDIQYSRISKWVYLDKDGLPDFSNVNNKRRDEYLYSQSKREVAQYARPLTLISLVIFVIIAAFL